MEQVKQRENAVDEEALGEAIIIELQNLNQRIDTLERKINSINKKTDSLWVKFKKRVIRMSKRNTFFGRMLRRALAWLAVAVLSLAEAAEGPGQ